jgi:hypothetical protein
MGSVRIIQILRILSTIQRNFEVKKGSIFQKFERFTTVPDDNLVLSITLKM